MSNEIPDWLQELSKTKPEDAAGKTEKSKIRSAKPKVELISKKETLTPAQMMILGVLSMLLCFICAAIVGLIYTNNDTLFGPASQEVVAASPVAEVPTLTPSPTMTDTPMPQATTTLSKPAATPKPSPTATYVVGADLINRDKIAEITAFVEKQRGLYLPEPVPVKFLTYQQLREQWREQSFDKAAIEAIQTRQEFYRALDLIEPDVDLVQASFDSQTDTLLGYYTPKEKVMYVVAESVNMLSQEEIIFAHEYTHALQDYHFDLDAFLNVAVSGDALLAMRSLPEGDARLVEELFISENINQDQRDYSVYHYLFQEHFQLEGVSPALGVFAHFPYTAGEYFVIYLLREGDYSWDMVNQAYKNPPISSEQVMHPEKYLAGEAPVPITLPDLGPALGDAWREIDRDVLGEIGLLAWLVDQVAEQTAVEAAAGWEGDTYTLWTDETNHRLLAEFSLWETEAEAMEFFKTFKIYMSLREGNKARHEETGAYFWKYEAKITFVSRQERQILIIVAPDRATLDRARSQFSGF